MILRYGRGKVIFDSQQDVLSLTLNFRGNPFIMHQYNTPKRTHDMSKGYFVKGKNILSFSGKIESDLCKYYGYFKITKCRVVLSNGESVNVQVKTMGINLPELMDEKPEDISESPEQLRHTYTVIKKYKGKQR